MLESRQTDRSGRNKREQCYNSGESTRTKRHVRPERRLVTNSADMPLLECSTSSGDSSRKVGASRNTRIRGNWFVRWTTLSLTSSPVSQSPIRHRIIGQLAKPGNNSKLQATSITHQRTQPCDSLCWEPDEHSWKIRRG